MSERSIKLQQINGGIVDIVNDYNWTVSTSDLARKEVPVIKIKEYQLTFSSIRNAGQYWFGQAAGLLETGKTGDPYEGLYNVEAGQPGNEYTIPYYNEYHHEIRNAWGHNVGLFPEMANQITETVTKVAQAWYPSAGIEQAKSWEGTDAAIYNVTFYLFNTVDPDNDIKKNKELIYALCNNNLKDKIDFLVTRPPCICQVEIPGVRGKTVAALTRVAISNMGQINKIDGDNVPDAYQIQLEVKELLNESRQILAGQAKKIFAEVEGVTGGIDTDVEAVRDQLEDVRDAAQRARES